MARDWRPLGRWGPPYGLKAPGGRGGGGRRAWGDGGPGGTEGPRTTDTGGHVGPRGCRRLWVDPQRNG